MTSHSNNEIKLTKRFCLAPKCGISWRCLPNDLNYFCSPSCKASGKEKGDISAIQIKKKKFNYAGAHDVRTVASGMTQHGERKTKLPRGRPKGQSAPRQIERQLTGSAENDTTLKKTKPFAPSTTKITEQKKSIGGYDMPERTVMSNVQKTDSGMPKIVNPNGEKSESGVSGVIQPTVSSPVSKITRAVESDTINLLDDSAKHLFNVMKGLTKDHVPEMIELADKGKSYETARVHATVACAREIRELMKTKIAAADLVRLLLKDEKER